MPGDKIKIDSPSRPARPVSFSARSLLHKWHFRGGAAPGPARAGASGTSNQTLDTTDDYTPLGAATTAARERPEEGRASAVVEVEKDRDRSRDHHHPAQPLAETRDLLRARLHAAVQWLVLILGLLLLRSVFLADRDLPLLMAHLWVLVALGIVQAWLGNDRDLTAYQLRVLELFLFGLVAGLLATGQYRLMLLRYRQDDAVLVLLAMKSSVASTIVLMLTYGIFISNDWKRATLVITAMALSPALVARLLLLAHPELTSVAAQVAKIDHPSDNALMLLIGEILAIFGTQIVGVVCARVAEAHHLGPYHLLQQIGSGGMGEVYLAEHQLLKRPCAIKLIRPGKAADPRALARFEREVRTTAQLSHWNTVEIYDYGRTEDGTFFYVMEYLPGLSLAELVERHGPLPPGRVNYLLRQACAALREAHSLGLIHRDIKPANIFAAYRGGRHDVTKLLDFGLAKRQAELPAVQVSHHGSITGSPLYMSPEQASGQRADHRSDIYALGAVAYYLLTGRAPFQGDNALSVMIAHARDAATPPTALRPDIPADLEQVVLRCLAKNPADRYQDAASLERALAGCGCGSAGHWTEDHAAEWWRMKANGPSAPAAEAGQAIASPPTVGLAC
jgi:serine/threonine-protein kinase